MLTVCRFHPGAWLLLLFLAACSTSELVEPTAESVSVATSGPKVNAPSNPNVSAIAEDWIRLSWQDNSQNESGFEVHRSTNGPAGPFTLRGSTGAGNTDFNEGGLSYSTQYCYEVRAFRTVGGKTSYSAFSKASCATTPPPAAPPAPSTARAYPSNSSAVGVSWYDNSFNEAGFRLERSLDAGSTWTTLQTLDPDVRWSSDEGRTSEQQVCYRAIAFRGPSDSPPSNTACTTPPVGPTNLTAASINPDWIEIALTWTDNSSVEDGYEVQMLFWNEYGSQWWTIDNLPANTTQYTQSSYIGGPFRVVATKDGGYSDFSNEAEAAF